MASQNDEHDKSGAPEPAPISIDGSSAQQASTQIQPSGELEFPAVKTILSALTDSAPSAPARGHLSLQPEEQDEMFRALQNVLLKADENEGNFDVKELVSSLEQADADSQRGQRNLKALEGVSSTLDKLWQSRSQYMAQAAEALANGSRDPSWRAPFGRAGILGFFLRVVASKEQIEDGILFHSLRLIGNSCADTDENRQIVVTDNYTLPIIRLFLNSALVHVAIPVIYNICTDFEPAQSQVAANRIGYILLKLISEGAIEGNSLLNYAYELVEMASEYEEGIEGSPDGTIVLLMNLAVDKSTTFAQYACLVNCLVAYLRNERFQSACIRHRLVEQLLSVLRHSYATDADESSSEDVQLLSQLRLKLNQALSDISALPQFADTYPLDSPLSNTLKAWLENAEDQLQICACVMLGNLARSDEVCKFMVERLEIHKPLIAMLKTDARGSVFHAALGFLKNLAIAGENRQHLGDAGIIPAVSHLWTFDIVPQVQFSAVSLTRQVITSSFQNVSRLLDSLSSDPDSPAHERSYLSLLLSLFGKTDAPPIKTEIGRSIASICRTVTSRAREGQDDAKALLERLFSLHEGIARPLGAMITQTEWPVVRSEGWFALALMASSPAGSLAVVDCLQNMDVYQLLEDSLTAEIPASASEAEKLQKSKDRDNVVILVKELLSNDPEFLSESRKARLQELMKKAASASVRESS
ncbi:hypothetical protein VTN77DRAFT_8498 [Rasamsonia byssochlamydoides]|uniref:uncharacterized protein n=1 Tax=Rasamsonia byssochlamydoides TaxID=89139 RepID=UPI0037425DCC